MKNFVKNIHLIKNIKSKSGKIFNIISDICKINKNDKADAAAIISNVVEIAGQQQINQPYVEFPEERSSLPMSFTYHTGFSPHSNNQSSLSIKSISASVVVLDEYDMENGEQMEIVAQKETINTPQQQKQQHHHHYHYHEHQETIPVQCTSTSHKTNGVDKGCQTTIYISSKEYKMVPHTNLTVNTFDNNGGGGCSKKDSGNNQAFEYASVFAMNQEPESPNSYDGDDDNDVVATANSGKSKSNSLLRARVVSRKEIQSESDEFKRPVVLRVVRARNTANKKLSQVGFRCKDSSFRYCSACWKPGVIDQDPEVSGAASECSCSHAEGANEDEDISKMAQPEEDEEEKGMEQRGHMLSQQRQQQVQIPHGGTYYPEDEHMVNQEHYSAICTYGDSANAYYDHEDSNYHGQYELEFEDQQGILYHEEEVSEGKEPHSMYTGYTYEEAQGSPQDTETHGYPTQSYYESTAGLGASHTFSSRWKPYYKYPHETERPHRHYSYRPRRVAPTSPPPGRYHGYNGGERLQINPETGGGPVIMGLRDMCVYDPGLFLTRLKSYRHQLSRYQSLFDRKFGSRSGQSNDYSHHYDGTRLDLDSETAAQHQPPDDDHEGVMREQISRLHAIVCKYNTVLYEHRLKQQRAREMRYYQYYSRNVQYRGPQRYHHSDYYHSGQDYEAKETQKERQYYDYCY